MAAFCESEQCERNEDKTPVYGRNNAVVCVLHERSVGAHDKTTSIWNLTVSILRGDHSNASRTLAKSEDILPRNQFTVSSLGFISRRLSTFVFSGKPPEIRALTWLKEISGMSGQKGWTSSVCNYNHLLHVHIGTSQ